jgi:hypothetical protein
MSGRALNLPCPPCGFPPPRTTFYKRRAGHKPGLCRDCRIEIGYERMVEMTRLRTGGLTVKEAGWRMGIANTKTAEWLWAKARAYLRRSTELLREAK